jgi:hypothetical protein
MIKYQQMISVKDLSVLLVAAVKGFLIPLAINDNSTNIHNNCVILSNNDDLSNFVGKFFWDAIQNTTPNTFPRVISSQPVGGAVFFLSNQIFGKIENLTLISRFKLLVKIAILVINKSFKILRKELKFIDINFQGYNFGKEIISRSINNSNYHRKRNIHSSFSLTLFMKLFSDLLVFELYSLFFQSNKPKLVVINDLYLFPFSSIIKAALNQNIKCIQFSGTHEQNSLFIKKLNQKNFYKHMTDFEQNIYIDCLSEGAFLNFDLNTYISELYLKNNWFSRNVKIKIDDEESKLEIRKLKEKSLSRPVFGVFPHIFWDGTSIYGVDIFQNYFSWFNELINYVTNPNNSDKFWIIKIHPDFNFKSSRFNPHNLKLRRDLYKISNDFENVEVLWADSPVSTNDLLEEIDFCLTVRGTVGIEFGLKGKKTICAGTGRYSSRGFTINPKTKDEYFRQLDTLVADSKLSTQSFHSAINYAKILFLLLPFRFKNPVFCTTTIGMNPLQDASSRISPLDKINFRNWFESSYDTYKSNLSDVHQ